MPPEDTTTPTINAAPSEAPAAAPVAPHAGTPQPIAYDWAPEKFRVMGQDGTLDVEATARKIAQGYTNAERLVGAERLPPDDPSGYKFTPPDWLAEAPVDNETLADFQSKAHEAGLTQAQFDFVLGEFYSRVPAMLEGQGALRVDQAKAALAEAWGSPVEVQRNMAHAEHAVSLMPQHLQAQIKQRYATDPVFWQFAAQFGREAREDRPVAHSSAPATIGNVEAVMQSEAYRNAKHPDHAKVSAMVRQHFERHYGSGSAM